MRRTSCLLLLLLAACSQTSGRTLRVGSETTTVSALTPGTVAAQVEVIPREEDILYRAPTLRVGREVNVRRSGPVVGSNLGITDFGQSGFLLGVRRRDTGILHHFAGYHSDFIEGSNRFKSVQTADGQELSFFLASAHHEACPNGCKLTFQTLMVELPDALLRNVTDAGLRFIITLDNGHQLPVTAPAAYVRGYLQAIDEAKQ